MPRGDIRIPLVPATRGVRTDLPAHLISPEYLSAGSNVLCRDGKVVVRPGYTSLSAAPTTNRIMGGIYYKDHANTERLILGTTASFHVFDGSNWSVVTGTALTGGNTDLVRFTVFMTGTSTRVIAVNDVDPTQTYTGSGNFANLGGSPPVAKCCTTAFQRVILGNITSGGTRRSSDLAISDFQDPTSWQYTVSLTDTTDTVVEVRALNAQTFAVYKDRSQWIGIGTDNIFPFIFELRDTQPGPVSPAAVIAVENVHYYLGQDGDIYRFDGTRSQSVGGPVKRLVQDNLDFENSSRVHGFYDRTNREIWWLWPSYASSVGTYGVVYRVPYGDVPAAFSPLVSFAHTLTASIEWKMMTSVTWNGLSTYTWNNIADTYPTWNSFPGTTEQGIVLGRSTGAVYDFGRSTGDDGGTFDATFDSPWIPIGGIGKNTQVDTVESFFTETSSTVTARLSVLTTNTLADSGTQQTETSVDLSSGNRLRATYGGDVLARFVRLRHRLLGVTGLQEYLGGVFYGWSREED